MTRRTIGSRPRASAALAATVLAIVCGPAAADKPEHAQPRKAAKSGPSQSSAGEPKPAPVSGRGKRPARAPAKAKAGPVAGKSPDAAPAQTAVLAAPAVVTPLTATPAATTPSVPPSLTARKPRRRQATAKRPRPTAGASRPVAIRFSPDSITSVPRLVVASPSKTRSDVKREPKEPSGSVTRTVAELVEVVPEPVKLLLAALGVLSAVLGGGYLLTSARARRLARQRSDLLQEVGLLQTALLPPVPAKVGAVRTSVAYRPSDGPAAGGDFYDAMTLPGGRAAFILGDVSGHGRAALARTAFMRYTLRAYLEAGLDPRTTLQVAGRVIDDHLGGDFATVVLAVHDPRSGSLTYACAGHPAPIVTGSERHEPVLAGSSPPIGLGLRTGLRQTTLPLPSGSVACLYTDGLAEARTEDGILGRPRLGDIVAELGRNATAQDLLDHVAREARLVTDDMATVVLTPTAGVTAGGFRSEQLEVDGVEEAGGDLPRRFLAACGVSDRDFATAAVEAVRLARQHGGAVLDVVYGIRGSRVDVLPRNVESLEAASRRAVTAIG